MLAPCLLCLVAAAAAAPSFDQRQDGDFNVRADVQNVVLLVAVPDKMSFPLGIFSKSAKGSENGHQIQQRSDFRVMEAFVEPSTPYHVEIGGGGEGEGEGSGRGIEVVIAGRRRTGPEPQAEPDEYKLLGATEQCGPDSERDPDTLACRRRSNDPAPATTTATDPQPDHVKELASKPAPEVVPSSP